MIHGRLTILGLSWSKQVAKYPTGTGMAIRDIVGKVTDEIYYNLRHVVYQKSYSHIPGKTNENQRMIRRHARNENVKNSLSGEAFG